MGSFPPRPKSSMQQRTRLKKNNFDLLRFIFATVVCVVHSYRLSGESQLAWTKTILSSEIAVKAFFVVSGFLIFMSYERSSSLFSYINKRTHRIYPAYFTLVVLCAIFFALASAMPYQDFYSQAWAEYLLSNLTFLNFLQPTLPALFCYLGNFGRFGDFSYGIYIVHFPIIQILLSMGWFKGNGYSLLAATLSLTLITAIAMWHLVEKRFLARNNHYRAVTS